MLPSQPMRYATIPIDDDSSQRRLAAYAIANPTTQNLVIKLALVDQDGWERSAFLIFAPIGHSVSQKRIFQAKSDV